MMLPGQEPAAYLRQADDELKHLHLQGAGGQELARRRADLLDLVLISLFRQAEHDAASTGAFREMGAAVVAVGGYGRRELCPFSDVDLMLLYSPEAADSVEGLAERLFYPLWDAGLELGHGARTVDECVNVSADSFEIETSLLQARLLVGDQALFAELLERLRRRLAQGGAVAFVERLAASRDHRHDVHGPTGALLEPHLKEGRGALRDVHEVLWLASALHGASGLDGLVSVGWVTPGAALELGGAIDRLLRARSSLHYAVGRRIDRLYLDYQADAALLYQPAGAGADTGAAGEERAGRVEVVMTEVWDAAEAIAAITAEIWGAALPGRAGPALAVSGAEDPAERRSVLLEQLRRGRDGIPAMEWLSHRGLLSAWIPGWKAIRHLGQMDSLHTYTVGGHALRSVAAAVDLAAAGDAALGGVNLGGDEDEAGAEEGGPPSYDSLGASLASALRGGGLWDTLLLACLLHDVGKGSDPAHHAEAGAALAADCAAALGESAEVQDTVRFLVAEHLLLSGTAVRRDLEDPVLVARLANIIGSRDRLELLYVLSVADSMATGPAVWTPWTAALARELFFRVLHVLDEGAGAGPAGEVRQVATPDGAATAASGIAQGGPGVPQRSASVTLGPSGGALALEVRPSPLPGVEELLVVSPPHPGVLARVSGVLACHGITILSAQVLPEEAGTVSRVFHVADQFEGTVPEERWEMVERDLARVFAGRLSLDYRLAERRARYAVGPSAGERGEPVRVVVENSVSDAYTVIEVHAADRVGLLHELARSLDDLLLQVKVAKVATQRERVVDVFYVTDAWGDKLLDPAHLQEVERALLYALGRSA